MISLRQPKELWKISRRLGLGTGSACKLFCSYYFSRRPALKRLCPSETVVIDAPRWGRLPIRVNGYDYKLLNEIFVEEFYDVKIRDVYRILDLGANIGMASIYLARLYPGAEIACVEPSPKNTPLLRYALDLNGIRARIFEAAIGTTDGTIQLNLTDEPAATSVLPVEGITNTVEVRLISMASLMRELQWTDIDVLKVDIEGYEKFLLRENNSWLRNVRLILGELHAGAKYPLDQMARDLGEFGFEVKRVAGDEANALMFSALNTRLTSRVAEENAPSGVGYK